MIDPARLASTIAGTGIVFVAAGPDIDDELEFLLVPREFRSPNGTVRVYAPGANFRLAQQAYRHRFFTRIQISEQSALEVEGQIARALTRRQAWAGVRSSVTSIDDLAQRRRESRLAALQHQSDQVSKDERLQIFHEDNTRLSRVATELTKSNEALEERLDEFASQVEQLRDTLRTAEYSAEFYRTESERRRQLQSASSTAAEAVKTLRQLPRSLAAVVELIEQLHPERIVFTEEAKKSALNATLDDPNVGWECLHMVATVLPRLAFDESSKDLASEFQRRSGFELSLTEGKMTKKDQALAELRKITFEGRQWNVSPHVKYGTKPPKCLRVHFALDTDEQRVIVGYCGDHMKTAGTKRRK